tara:strand:+ start:1683 stop:2285 length:603 start_codon:yes stop_codon:yes gene_type:complete
LNHSVKKVSKNMNNKPFLALFRKRKRDPLIVKWPAPKKYPNFKTLPLHTSMKYETSITIDLPLEETIAKMDSLENLKHWQKGLKSYKVLSGTPGEEGAKMQLRYENGKRKITLVETILKRDLPHEFHATYEMKGVHNLQENFFSKMGDNKTKWVSRSIFKFEGWGMKLLGLLMPSAFKKQSLKYMNDFKAFAEKGESVAG